MVVLREMGVEGEREGGGREGGKNGCTKREGRGGREGRDGGREGRRTRMVVLREKGGRERETITS